jgi:hypothetical protein
MGLTCTSLVPRATAWSGPCGVIVIGYVLPRCWVRVGGVTRRDDLGGDFQPGIEVSAMILSRQSAQLSAQRARPTDKEMAQRVLGRQWSLSRNAGDLSRLRGAQSAVTSV